MAELSVTTLRGGFAREARGILNARNGKAPDGRELRRFVAYCEWDGELEEELDIDATDVQAAQAYAQQVLDDPDLYEPGGTVSGVEEKVGWYL